MTQTAESGSTEPRPPDPLGLLLPRGLGCALPDPWANRRGAMLLLRGLRRRDGWPLVTSAHLAHAWGDAERRHGHTCWAAFEACGAALAACFQRRTHVDAEGVAHGTPIWPAHPLGNCAHVLAACRRRWPESGALLRAQHRRTAGQQGGS